jgi:hypothetical protein
MAKRHGLRRWPVGTKSGYSRAEIFAAYDTDVADTKNSSEPEQVDPPLAE